MLKSDHCTNQLIGSIEDINILDIIPASNILRTSCDQVQDLAASIMKIGLLSPLLVRTLVSGKYEIIAGNRRFKACKKLGWRKISCCVAELDNKTAFEASIIENVQRHTLNIIEEGLAFRKYVNEFGWGGVSELASKLSKSSSYVSKRIRLLDLSPDVLNLICESEISISTGEELLSLTKKDQQSKLAKLVVDTSLSSKKLRMIIKKQENIWDSDKLFYSKIEEKHRRILKAFDESIIILKTAVNNLAVNIEKIQDEWVVFEAQMHHKNVINSQIDLLIREKKKFMKGKIYLANN